MDFRAIEDPLRKSNLEDIYYPLLPAEKVRIDELYDFAAQKTLKCKYKNLCGVREASFLCNKTPVLSFIWRVETGLKIRISLPLPMSAEHDLLLSRINELDNAEEIKDFCLHNLYECFYCSKTCVQHNAHKKKWIVLGHLAPKLTTSCWGFGLFFTLSDENLALTEKLVDMLTEIYKSYH